MNAYIGKKLTLISKSDIRYEGTVYSLDTTDSSLTLTGGTWGRAALIADRVGIPRDRGRQRFSRGLHIRRVDAITDPSPPPPVSNPSNRSAIVRHGGPPRSRPPDPRQQRNLRLDHLQREGHQIRGSDRGTWRAPSACAAGTRAAGTIESKYSRKRFLRESQAHYHTARSPSPPHVGDPRSPDPRAFGNRTAWVALTKTSIVVDLKVPNLSFAKFANPHAH